MLSGWSEGWTRCIERFGIYPLGVRGRYKPYSVGKVWCDALVGLDVGESLIDPRASRLRVLRDMAFVMHTRIRTTLYQYGACAVRVEPLRP